MQTQNPSDAQPAPASPGSFRRKAIASGLVGLLAIGASVGIATTGASAQPAPEPDADTASAESVEDRQAARLERMTERLSEKVAAGNLTQAEADEILERVSNGEFIRRGHASKGERRQVVLDALGIDAETLREARQAGDSLATIASDNGVSVAELVDTLVAEATSRINDKLADGKIDADRAAEKLDGLAERITERVNTEPAERSFGEGRRGPRPGSN